MKIYLCGVLAAATLLGCSNPPQESAETSKRIALCEEVMRTYIKEANTYARDQKRLIGSCHISQKERTLEQWQCALDSMQKGEKYEAASNKCGRSGTASAQ
jgi:hypothetical protein